MSNSLISTKQGRLIGTKLCFLINPDSILKTMISEFMLDSIFANVVFQSVLSIDIVAKLLELWSGVRFRIMDVTMCYELRVFSISTNTSVKSYNPKSFLLHKVFLKLNTLANELETFKISFECVLVMYYAYFLL